MIYYVSNLVFKKLSIKLLLKALVA